MTVYMKVTKDKYELPLIIADSVKELAERLNINPNNISSSLSHAKHRGHYSPYRKIEIEDEVSINDNQGTTNEC